MGPTKGMGDGLKIVDSGQLIVDSENKKASRERK